jgi:hypothetical protein
MFYVSLVLSIGLLVGANEHVWRRDRFLIVFVGAGAVCSFLPVVIGLAFFPPVALLFVLLCVLVYLRWLFTWGPRVFLPLSLACAVIAFVLPAYFWWPAEREEYARLRDEFRYESLDDRLPPPRHNLSHLLSADAAERLDRLENDNGMIRGMARSEALRPLHEAKVQQFLNSSGFGVTRMSGVKRYRYSLKDELRKEEPVIRQPGPWGPPSSRSGNGKVYPNGEAPEALSLMHEYGVLDFLYPGGLGFFKDRHHVAGFHSHKFSELPTPLDPATKRYDQEGRLTSIVQLSAGQAGCEMQVLQLVGLVVHDQPVVYLSDNLPNMDEVRKAPTRPLDEFEEAALAELRRGEDFQICRMSDSLRMLGAIRATKQCVNCHDCERGDLLDAFTYLFRGTGPKEEVRRDAPKDEQKRTELAEDE